MSDYLLFHRVSKLWRVTSNPTFCSFYIPQYLRFSQVLSRDLVFMLSQHLAKRRSQSRYTSSLRHTSVRPSHINKRLPYTSRLEFRKLAALTSFRQNLVLTVFINVTIFFQNTLHYTMIRNLLYHYTFIFIKPNYCSNRGLRGKRYSMSSKLREKCWSKYYYFILHVLFRHYLLKHIIKGQIEGRTQVTGRQGIRRRQLLDDPKKTTGEWKLKEEALESTVWGICFGRCYELILRQTMEWMNEWMNEWRNE